VIERRQRLVILTEIQVRITQADLQPGIIRRERSRFLQLWSCQVILVPLGVHRAQVRVRKLVQRIVLELPVESVGRVVVFPILPIRATQIVVGVLIVRIYFERLLE
jgi:hypothetical protein